MKNNEDINYLLRDCCGPFTTVDVEYSDQLA